MSQTQYLRFLEKEIQKINKKIDFKIVRGEEYFKEARDHKLLLRKVRYHTRRSLGGRLLNLFFRTDILRKNIYA
ncbi:hypothetical protein A2911_01880 [Candidatus Nomurabacteria bacterium RIFCSPLOWO2_01_FULL_40_15]|uniref:Uncharacterized protein n=1 Tax=Candidatus Nomurabacteria bacterium RIFCSPLOWO2_01_FULL_40_15 TaxID=1801772 RepID=A0A1F6X9A5_9BACT|nr:MAG: hypothetical protein A2911_01880 [Candidatus Nomurabacteria bacterium RIFCSPLOWO2_01_FULL_40_15]